MRITIDGGSDEIAALVLAVQERRFEDLKSPEAMLREAADQALSGPCPVGSQPASGEEHPPKVQASPSESGERKKSPWDG